MIILNMNRIKFLVVCSGEIARFRAIHSSTFPFKTIINI